MTDEGLSSIKAPASNPEDTAALSGRFDFIEEAERQQNSINPAAV
jgi:hypothetical protein